MKKVSALIVCLVFVLLATITATADGNTQCYNLTSLGDDTLVFTAKNNPTLWEKPTLTAGEYSLNTGKLIVRNSTQTEQKVGLSTVVLPYDNEDALRYLNHIYITVRSNDTILYDGPYSRINDDRDFTMNTVLPTNTEAEYSIDIRCDYGYTGNGFTASDVITWEFYAVPEATDKSDNVSEHFSNSALLEVLLACGFAVVLLVGVFVYDRYRRNH